MEGMVLQVWLFIHGYKISVSHLTDGAMNLACSLDRLAGSI